jgi:hypothetical protein
MKVFLPPATSKTFLKTHLSKEESFRFLITTSGSFQLTLYELFGHTTILAEVGNGRGCPVLPKSPTNDCTLATVSRLNMHTQVAAVLLMLMARSTKQQSSKNERCE